MSDKDVKIVLYDARSYDIDTFNEVNEKFKYNINYLDCPLDEESVSLAKGYELVIAFASDVVNEKVVGMLKDFGVKFIAMRCAGYNNVDIKAVKEAGIKIARVPAYSPHAIAEHAATMLLALTRRLPQATLRTRSGNFALNGLLGRELFGLTGGVLGTGKIGRITAEILGGLGMKVVLYDVVQATDWAKEKGFTYLQLEEFFKVCDVISLHCPLTPETKYIINERSLAMMKNDAVIVNTARGPVVDTAALIQALKKKEIGGAALDVYEEEREYFFSDWSSDIIPDDVLTRLLTFPNVLVTPHYAYFTKNALINIAEVTLENVRAFISGEPLENEIKE